MSAEELKMEQWWRLSNPCKNEPIMGINFKVCEDLENLKCRGEYCSKKVIHQASFYLLKGETENYIETIKKMVDGSIELDYETQFFILDEKVIEKAVKIEECSRWYYHIDDEILSVCSDEELELLNYINGCGNYLLGLCEKDMKVPQILLKEMKKSVKEALETNLYGLDEIAKLGIIFGMEEKMFQLTNLSFFNNEIKLRGPVLEDV